MSDDDAPSKSFRHTIGPFESVYWSKYILIKLLAGRHQGYNTAP